MNEADFDRLVGAIYESALNPELWRDTLGVLAHHVGADFFHLVGWDSRERVATLGVVPEMLWDGAPDPAAAQAGDPPDHLACLDLRHLLGGCLAQRESLSLTLGLLRDARHGPFEPRHESLLARLTPHFDRALRLMEHIQATTQARDQALAGQHASALSVISVGAAGQLLHCNRNGDALLKGENVLRVRHGQLECTCDEQQAKFTGLIDAVVTSRRPANLLLHPRLEPERRYSATLTPLPGPDSANDPAEEILCLVVPLDQRRIATAQQLMQLFGLSAAEARLARALAGGQTIEAYAQESDLRLPTVKSQLHAAFEKTGTDRQAALVRLIVGVPAVRDRG
ncbi:MAG: hypothetical protein LDL19_03115 [Thiobacillus sp.]|nr:hypothetical protein [Thiobacillus sp.]